MAKIKIEEYDIWYDDETDLIFDEEGTVRSSIPKGTFVFDGKLYTYGTKVRLNDYWKYVAEFKKDTEEKRVIMGGGYHTMPMKRTKEYFDGKPFELDDIFLEVGGTRKTYLSSVSLDNNILEIVDPVPYVSSRKQPTEPDTPPVQNGYRTITVNNPSNPTWNRWRDHLFNCDVDASGEVTDWYAPCTFGFGKYVYTIGTRVIIKHREFHKNHFYVATFDGNNFVIEGYPKPWETLNHSMFKKNRNSKGFSIIHIIEPHYYKPEAHQVTGWEKFKMNGGPTPVDTSVGTIWYIIIMVVGTIFKARIGIWVVATIVYFLWRFGYLNKK